MSLIPALAACTYGKVIVGDRNVATEHCMKSRWNGCLTLLLSFKVSRPVWAKAVGDRE